MTASVASETASGKQAEDANAFAAEIAAILTADALPGETDGFSEEDGGAAAAFVAQTASRRAAGQPSVALESIGGEGGRRLMRLVIVNDDMPFLVDSVAAAVAARGLAVHRLLHPIVAVRRDAEGRLTGLLPARTEGERRESIIYLEIERADAKDRRAIVDELEDVLSHVRAAVEDWPMLQHALREGADRLPDGEGAALLRWFLDGNMTLLGYRREAADGTLADAIGIPRSDATAVWGDAARAAAIAWFEAGNEAPLLLKADRVATVHRRLPLDMVVLPHRDGPRVTGLDIHLGLWTSNALATRPDRVPLLRRRLSDLEEALGFDPASHAGKALRHVLYELPHDLIIAFAPRALKQVALTAMSLADRPRPKLILIDDVLRRHLFAFVWLPREELTTSRREALGRMIAEAASGRLVNWAIDLGDGDMALLRYTIALPAGATLPDAEPLDRRLEQMVRGWAPAVEGALTERVGASRAARLALGYAGAFPAGYRGRSDAAEAADDIIRLSGLGSDADRAARLFARAGEDEGRLHLKIYRTGGLVPLSDVVPVLENFGFVVLEEMPTALDGGKLGHIHEFLLQAPEGSADTLMARAAVAEQAIAQVLEGRAENDGFNKLLVGIGLEPRAVVLLRAWFRYLRQTGLNYGLITVADAMARAPQVTRGFVELFDARHDPKHASEKKAREALAAIDEGLVAVAAIDDDRILRRMRGLIESILRTNAFAPAAEEALAFKLDSATVPDLPAPRPWREIWVYSPRVEGIHLRGGPIARGGLRWSDRRDDFRTEILGLMKAQVVKNAVIVPTGAKGGFYPKQLPSPADRKAWLAEGTESYRIFIRSLLSVTDNIVADAVVHPEHVRIRDGQDPYFVVAADKGTATFSDIANAIAVEHGFWLGDAFASGGSHGYDHKAMGITAKGAWVSVTRHFAEMGVDVQSDPIVTAGCGDMSGDVFGNGMLLSKTIKLVAAFDHRHIFLDPNPDLAKSWAERARLFALPASSWADYEARLISAGGGVFPRSQKAIPVSAEAAAALGIEPGTYDPTTLIQSILKAPVDLMWFGGIGTYIKASTQSHSDAGDPANDANRVDANQLRCKVIGEGANLSTTQAGRIEFGLLGGRSNTDFIDNSAGVDCSDNEVNIKIALNAEMAEGRLSFEDRNAFLASMTDDVAAIVLEDNRLQTLSLSSAERGGPAALPAQVGVIVDLESTGRLDRKVEGLKGNDELARRAQDGHGLTRPELAVILSHAKLTLQAAIEASPITSDPTLSPILHRAFPAPMQARFGDAIDRHRLRGEIIATKVANGVVNRLGLVAPFELSEEEGVGLARVAGAYLACDTIFGLTRLFADIEAEPMPETGRLELLDVAARMIRLHIADLLRVANPQALPGEMAAALAPGVARLDKEVDRLVKAEVRGATAQISNRLVETGASPALAERVARLYELDGAIATASLAARQGWSEIDVVAAYVRLGEALGLDWAKAAAQRAAPTDPWERLLTAGLARDFEQLRLDFLSRAGKAGPVALVDQWLGQHQVRVDRFARLVQRARTAASVTPAMLAQVAAQARILLARHVETGAE
ncbi:NAD-glutamate dehydrogenase [Sphingomonas oligoaromativorans]|uniref:NAD-glutamate dehydrogenase n=1 Tax=Sphingomonas oligoaromativorans TaxID=575322 RepID=UPI001ABA9D7E|nr:NAD-glutamate dehydrogenase domain-containing protein [Sphingomonas oligoaromativorans]NIJ34622.1 glutamate dehydrogenase [Sphingomonas oligoaromativorans]